MKTILMALASVFLFAFSCEGDKKETQQLNNLEKEAVDQLEKVGLKAEDFKGKIDELLTLEIAAQVSGLPVSEAKKDHVKFSTLESLKYKWKSDRTKKVEVVKGKPINVPLDNTIELSWVNNTTLKQFKHDYHNPSAEEIKNAEEAMDKKMNQLEADGKASKDQAEKTFNEAKGSISNFNVEEVPGLGEYSVFVNTKLMGATARDLKVYYRGLSFTLAVDLSDDVEVNDQKAIQTAKMIIQQKLN